MRDVQLKEDFQIHTQIKNFEASDMVVKALQGAGREVSAISVKQTRVMNES